MKQGKRPTEVWSVVNPQAAGVPAVLLRPTLTWTKKGRRDLGSCSYRVWVKEIVAQAPSLSSGPPVRDAWSVPPRVLCD